MREARNLSIGCVRLDGEDIGFLPDPVGFRAKPGERVALYLRFEFRESSDDKEHVRVALSGELAGQKLGSADTEVHDRIARVDDVWSHVALAFRAPSQPGAYSGTEHVEARYSRGAWRDDADQDVWRLVESVPFTLTVA